MTALRIGILGAARIAAEGIVEPARLLGHRLGAVAARDRARAEAFAAEHGVERAHDGYAEVIEDDEVDLVYNALVNSLHTRWNLAALEAGRHVLSEKPLAPNAAEASAVREVARRTGAQLFEGFHYVHHPVNLKLRNLVITGALGELLSVDITLAIPPPSDADPRWSPALAGGATMDLGCYVIHAARQVGRWIGTPPELVSAEATLRAPQLDAAMRVEVSYDGMPGHLYWNMDAPDRTMTWTITGTEGRVTSPAFGVPHLNNRLLIGRAGIYDYETLGKETSYTYQLVTLAAALAGEQQFPIDLDDSIANAELIDDVFVKAGLRPRGQ